MTRGTSPFRFPVSDLLETGHRREVAFDASVDWTLRLSQVGPPLHGGVADLESPIRDTILLELPLAPTCRPGCLGLCARCGGDLNTGSCPGHEKESDSPFASLREL